MNRNVLITGVVFILLISACAPRGTPTADPIDIQNTAEAAAFTMVAETQASVPTATLIPPTETASPTLPPSSTPLPLPTSGTPGLIPTGAPTSTQQAPPAQVPPTSNSGNGGGTQDVCNQPLTAWQGPTANFSVANQTQPQGTIVLSMYVVTDLGQCGYLIINGDSFSGPIGSYSAGAFVTGKQNFKAFGSFRITEGNWAIVVKNDSIEARGGCYPNC
ncbi:MAG TPA: hypothetical protein VJ830_01880 [Anaerolineales bacterium]|nr:hypothetical protein [Anaerolineales bacterium]